MSEQQDSTKEDESAQNEQPRQQSAARFVAATAMVVAALGGSTLFLAHCSRQDTPPLDASEGDLVAGAAHYRTYCALCHGDEGEGYAADDANALANQDFLVSVTDEFIREGIAAGHPGTAMAAYAKEHGGPLEEVEIDQLVAFIRAWQEEPSVEGIHDLVVTGDVTRGRAAYQRECARCHGNGGVGGSGLSLNNPVFTSTASDGQIRYAIAHGRRGTPMPAFEGELQDSTIDDIVALIRSWERAAPEAPTEMENLGEGPVVLNPDGDAPEFPELREGRYVPMEAVAEAVSDGRRIIFLDARAPSDYVRFHIVGAIPSPYYSVEEVKERLPTDGTWIVAYCACPHAASGRVMDYLREQGFENTAVLDEGVLAWEGEGYPVVRGESPGTLEDAE